MTQQLFFQAYYNNEVSSNNTSPTCNSDDKCNAVNDMSPLSSLSSHVPDVGNKMNYKINNNNNQYYYDYYNYGMMCNYINDKQITADDLTLNDYMEDDNVSECNSLGNATFVPAPFLYLNHDSVENDNNNYSFDYANDFTTNYDKINNVVENIQNKNENICDAFDNYYNNNNLSKEKKRRMNFTMMPASHLQYTLDEILTMNALLYYTTNIEGSKLIQYLLDNEENNGKKISQATCCLFNQQLLNKDENGNTIGMVMCCNIYGNYVMQKYLSVAPFQFVDEIICKIICPNAYQLAFDKHGSRVLQFAITNNSGNHNNNNNDDDDISNKNNSDNGSMSNKDLHNDNMDNEFEMNDKHNGMNAAMKKLNVYCYYILYYITLQNHLLECVSNISVNHIIQKCINHLNNKPNGINNDNNDNKNGKIITNLITNTESDNDDQNEEEQENESVKKITSKMKYKLFDMMLIQMQCKLHDFSLHKYGCRIIQSLLDFGNAKQKNFIIQTLIPHLTALACDKYGNYVIQKIIFYNRVLACNQWNNEDNNSNIIPMLITNFYQLCLNKYGSNVAELCYQYSNDVQKQAIIQQLTSYQQENQDKSSKKIYNIDREKTLTIISLIKHEYGNYVVQKIINLSNDKQRYLLLSVIKKHLSYLKHQIYKFPSIKLFVKNFFPSAK